MMSSFWSMWIAFRKICKQSEQIIKQPRRNNVLCHINAFLAAADWAKIIIKVKHVTLFTPGIYYWKIKKETRVFSTLMKGCYQRAVFKAKLYKISMNTKYILINMLLPGRQYIWAKSLIMALGEQKISLIRIF